MHDGTRVVRAGLPDPTQGEPFLPGPTLAAPFHLSGDPEGVDYVYGRYGNPTWTAVERALGELEGGEAVLFASGMAAVAAVLLTRLRPGDKLLLPSDCYLMVRSLGEEHLSPRGIEVGMTPTTRLAEEPLDGVTLVWAETPSNPVLEVCDLRALAQRCQAAGAMLAVDNTTATPLGQRPLELGADISLASATKALGGHADLLLGYVATRDAGLAGEMRDWRKRAGAVPGPFEAWLLHRSLATLDVRLERQCANAQAIAELLEARHEASEVRYPGLASDPGHGMAAGQMTRFGGVVSFDLGSRERAERFLAGCALVTDATSFGGVLTTAERRARWGGDDVPEGFIRLSAGCERPEDLLADISSALDALT